MGVADREPGTGLAGLGPGVGLPDVLVELSAYAVGREEPGATGVQVLGGAADPAPVGAVPAPFEDGRVVGGDPVEAVAGDGEVRTGFADL